jgi:hypothetical protein
MTDPPTPSGQMQRVDMLASLARQLSPTQLSPT